MTKFINNMIDIRQDIENNTYNEYKILNKIIVSEAYLPLDDRYNEFNKLYSRYVNISKRYLSRKDRNYDEEFKKVIDSIIECFKRIKNDSRSSGIDNIEEQMIVFEKSFERKVEPEKPNETSTWGKIARSYIN